MLDNNHDGLIFHFCQLLLKMTCRRFKLFENILVCKLHIILSTENDQANSTQYLPWLSQQMAPPTQSHTPKTTSRHEANVDGVFNYACSTLFLGMVVKQLTDSVHEGDAEREELCWKLMLLLFKVKIHNRNRTKYAYVAIKYLCLIKALLTPIMAHKLKWGRYFNDTGRPGGCIPIDQRV